MAAFQLKVNDQQYQVEADPDTPLLWVLREKLGLTGTKYGCGKSYCGSCTIHVEGNPTRACVTPVSLAVGKKIRTIEGLSQDGLHPIQEAWIKAQVPQCGYCQSGFIMQAVTLLKKNKKPSREEIIAHLDGNICRCGTYLRMIQAIEQVAKEV